MSDERENIPAAGEVKPPFLIQLHWQNRDSLEQTEFVGQFEVKDDSGAWQEWFREVVERRGNEMPAGWIPLICTQDSPYFVWAVSDAAKGT